MGGQVLVDFEGVIRTHHVNKEVSGRATGPSTPSSTPCGPWA